MKNSLLEFLGVNQVDIAVITECMDTEKRWGNATYPSEKYLSAMLVAEEDFGRSGAFIPINEQTLTYSNAARIWNEAIYDWIGALEGDIACGNATLSEKIKKESIESDLNLVELAIYEFEKLQFTRKNAANNLEESLSKSIDPRQKLREEIEAWRAGLSPTTLTDSLHGTTSAETQVGYTFLSNIVNRSSATSGYKIWNTGGISSKGETIGILYSNAVTILSCQLLTNNESGVSGWERRPYMIDASHAGRRFSVIAWHAPFTNHQMRKTSLKQVLRHGMESKRDTPLLLVGDLNLDGDDSNEQSRTHEQKKEVLIRIEKSDPGPHATMELCTTHAKARLSHYDHILILGQAFPEFQKLYNAPGQREMHSTITLGGDIKVSDHKWVLRKFYWGEEIALLKSAKKKRASKTVRLRTPSGKPAKEVQRKRLT